jgi:hypothetical protein
MILLTTALLGLFALPAQSEETDPMTMYEWYKAPALAQRFFVSGATEILTAIGTYCPPGKSKRLTNEQIEWALRDLLKIGTLKSDDLFAQGVMYVVASNGCVINGDRLDDLKKRMGDRAPIERGLK